MKGILTFSAAACLLAGCASTDRGTAGTSPATQGELLSDQPQTAIAGEGSLMPGAYNNRLPNTGQFTGRERTNDQIGQRPTLPREADASELARDSSNETAEGVGTLGQTGIVHDEPVSTRTIMETTAETPPAHVAVAPPGSRTEQERVTEEGIGAPPSGVQGSGSDTNAPAQNGAVENSRPE